MELLKMSRREAADALAEELLRLCRGKPGKVAAPTRSAPKKAKTKTRTKAKAKKQLQVLTCPSCQGTAVLDPKTKQIACLVCGLTLKGGAYVLQSQHGSE